MKKWMLVTSLMLLLSGCGSTNKEVDVKKEETKETLSTVETIKPPKQKKVSLREVDFQIMETPYKMDVLENWVAEKPEEHMELGMGDENKGEYIGVYATEKIDFESFDAFKQSFIEQMMVDGNLQLVGDKVEKQPCQTVHYSGEEVWAVTKDNGILIEIHHYLLETETAYVGIDIIAVPSFFEKNTETVVDILNSFVAI
ncbi:hypothetical protein [Enterococcus caccae]|uniref:Lipoprotein n=1 Tax=Enterococcus caccae ATCC BAA-1240 TaxID=1158612 RepID=R3WC48_9ENTE|nr:hypothetical protein [Enterococcus caccae]EOL45032.1 hypothetical protein UC7_01838 [Enterococcus caccae ATCC BAA-1240]EOT58439.1 hypothetical protein I580_02610 [Enterococcus caccae ATCC BAA-1240]